MSTYTINAVRAKLGSLMKNVFTDDFKSKYESATKEYNDIAMIMQEQHKNTDQYVLRISKNISSLDSLKSINRNTTSEVILTFFMRYHFLTQYLVSRNQNEHIELPGDEESFIKEIFLNYWTISLSK